MTRPSDPPAGVLSLLRRNAGFRSLSTARVVSFVGDSLSLVALMLHVAGTSQSPMNRPASAVP